MLESDLSIATIVSSNLAEDDLLAAVALNFGLQVDGVSKATLLRDLEQLFVQQARTGRRILLIVDEAQNLPPPSVEELRMLSNFQSAGKPLVQIFLLGQQEFRKTLLSEGFEQLRQRIIATYHLKPLSDEETRTYIEHRLAIAGWQHRPLITDDAYEAIYSFCDGVPRRINNLCDRLLLFAFLEERDTIDGEVVQSVSEEIGEEFLGGLAEVPDPITKAGAEALKAESGQAIFDSPDVPLESVARGIFDKADVQNRLTALERAIEGLDSSLKPDVAQIREEMGFLRLMLEDVLHEVRELSQAASESEQTGAKKKRA